MKVNKKASQRELNASKASIKIRLRKLRISTCHNSVKQKPRTITRVNEGKGTSRRRVSQRSRSRHCRFGPNTAAATYECDDQDLQWLESQRDAFVAENMKEKKKMNTMMKKKDQRQQGEQGKLGADERRRQHDEEHVRNF